MTQSPILSGSERADYDRLAKRIHRAQGEVRGAKKRGDEAKLARAERSLANAQAALREFLAPKVDPLWAPMRIVAKFKQLWSGPSGSGFHHHECEMVLDGRDLSGPSYRTVRVLRDEGAPPTNARSAPDRMGVAWFAIADQITRGQIIVLDSTAEVA